MYISENLQTMLVTVTTLGGRVATIMDVDSDYSVTIIFTDINPSIRDIKGLGLKNLDIDIQDDNIIVVNGILDWL